VEQAIRSYARVDDCEAFTYTLDGHLCAVLRFPSAGACWVYDATTNEWHERATYGYAGFDIADCAMLDGVPYVQWAQGGHIETMPGNTVDWRYVVAHIEKLAEQYNIQAIAYDRYGARDTAQQLQDAQSGDGKINASSEVKVIDKFGAEHEMQFSAVILGEEVFGLWVDLTERNQAERLLRERQEQLARVGRVSTLGQLAASLAHELDQPLGAILNNAEAARLMLVRQTPDVSELRAIVDDILADDRRAGAVLDRIRGMVRQRKFESQAVPVEPLLREVARLVRPLAASQRIALQISCEPGTPAIEGDPVLLQQALLNLGLNAVEAIGDRRDGRIEIRAGEAKAGLVEVGLSDNGGGVPEAQFGSLFEPFYTTKREGLGMGLPLVRSIAEQHGGQVRLDNQPGRGLAVYLRLPARPA
jgi:C4-dicarboxylate-specific signal transduction histidine kinase